MKAKELTMIRTLFAVATIALLGLGAAEAAGDAAAGKTRAAACAGCHGANGEGVGPNPPLAGMSEPQFVQAMQDYKSGKRANPVMKSLAAPLNEQDTANLAAYYASLKK
jgi:cytochrome c553